jgi:hypothetical protein
VPEAVYGAAASGYGAPVQAVGGRHGSRPFSAVGRGGADGGVVACGRVVARAGPERPRGRGRPGGPVERTRTQRGQGRRGRGRSRRHGVRRHQRRWCVRLPRRRPQLAAPRQRTSRRCDRQRDRRLPVQPLAGLPSNPLGRRLPQRRRRRLVAANLSRLVRLGPGGRPDRSQHRLPWRRRLGQLQEHRRRRDLDAADHSVPSHLLQRRAGDRAVGPRRHLRHRRAQPAAQRRRRRDLAGNQRQHDLRRRHRGAPDRPADRLRRHHLRQGAKKHRWWQHLDDGNRAP